MAAARYWRLTGLASYAGGDVELAGLHWYSQGARVDATAVITSSAAPMAGALTSLQDTDAATVCRFARADTALPGFYLAWDFGSTVEITQLWVYGSIYSAFPGLFALQRSSDGVAWTYVLVDASIWQGAGQPFIAGVDTDWLSVTALINGADRITDTSTWSWPVQQNGSVGLATLGGRKCISLDVGKNLFLRNVGANLLGRTPANFSIEIDGYFTRLDNAPHLINFGDSGLNRLTIYLAFGQIRVFSNLNGSAGDRMTSSVTLATNTWYRIRFVCVANTGYLYVNDAQVASASAPMPTVSDGASVSIGFQHFGGITNDYMVGGVRNVRFTPLARQYAPGRNGDLLFPDQSYRPGQQLLMRGLGASEIPSEVAPLPVRSAALGVITRARDMEFSGRGQFAGTLKTKGTPNAPAHRRIRLVRDRDALLVRETWSDAASGAWSFTEIDEAQAYTVEASDYEGNYRTVVASNVIPQLMP